MLWFLFLFCSAAAAVALDVSGLLSPLLAALAFLGILALFNGLYIVFLWVVSLFCKEAEPPETPSPFLSAVTYLTVNWMMKVCRVYYRGRHMERVPKEPTVIISNHLSRFDPMVLYSLLRGRKITFISKKENMTIPIIGPIMLQVGFLPLDRENPLRAMRTIRTGTKMIRDYGYTVGIYPESTRNKTDDLLEFKPGAFVMAKRAEVPITVTIIRGIRGNTRRLFTRASVEVLDVIPADVVAEKKPEELAQICFDRIHAAMEQEAAF